MLIRIVAFFSMVISVIFLSGCKKEAPKCSDEVTLSIVRNIFFNRIGGSGNLSKKEIENFFKFEYPRATEYDEKIKKYSCEARLIIDGKAQMPLNYSIQLNDDGEPIAVVNNLFKRDLWLISQLLQQVKNTKALENNKPAENNDKTEENKDEK